MELLNVPQQQVVKSGYCLIRHTTCKVEIGIENGFLLPHVDFYVHNRENSLCNTISGTLHILCEHNV
jgi:hypothetical protein